MFPQVSTNVVGTVVLGVLGTAALWLLFNNRNSRNKAVKSPQKQNGPNPRMELKLAKEIRLKQERESSSNEKKKKRDPIGEVTAIQIFYGTQTGTAKKFAVSLSQECEKIGKAVTITDISAFDASDAWPEQVKENTLYAFIVSTYTDGKPPESASWFCEWLEDAAYDFRVQKTLLKNMKCAVLGLGNSLYNDHFGTVGRNIDDWLQKLGALRVLDFVAADENVAESTHEGIEGDFNAWRNNLINVLTSGHSEVSVKEKCGTCSECSCKKQEKSAPAAEMLYESSSDEEEALPEEDTATASGVVDLEDLGNVIVNLKKAKVKRKKKKVPTATLR